MATFKDTARDFNGLYNGLYSDIYFTKGNLKSHYFYQCPDTRLMTDIIKTPSGKYDVIFTDMDSNQQTIDRLVRPTLKAAKESVINFLNDRIAKLNLETIPETKIVEDISEIFNIDDIDDQLFSNNSINDIVGIDLIDNQLFNQINSFKKGDKVRYITHNGYQGYYLITNINKEKNEVYGYPYLDIDPDGEIIEDNRDKLKRIYKASWRYMSDIESIKRNWYVADC